MPIALRDFVTGDSNVKQPLDVTSSKELAALDDNILTQLVQWSDLVIFDYLTGNYDRVASMQVTLNYFYLPSFFVRSLLNEWRHFQIAPKLSSPVYHSKRKPGNEMIFFS